MKSKSIKKSVISNAAGKIPFVRCYEEEGIIESAPGLFTEMFLLKNIRIEDFVVAQQKIEALFASLPENCSYQFVIHNALISKEEYLKTVLIPQDKAPEALMYNNVILNNMDIGHNNVKKQIYFVIGYRASVVDEAVAFFQEHDSGITSLFSGAKLQKLTLLERLNVIYQVFNPEQDKFGDAIDLNSDGNLNIANLKYMKMTAKDLVAPVSWNTNSNLLNYTHINANMDGECFSRTFFLNCIPKEISTNVVNDLTSVSSNMLMSIIFMPVDSRLSYDAVTEKVNANTSVVRKQKRETIQDKKNHTVIEITNRKKSDENAYFYEAAQKTLKMSVASDTSLMEAYITITLFASNMEDLERNTELLKISATKFACSVKPLDLYQYEGFATTLPLCNPRVDVSRFLDVKKMAALSPVVNVAGVKPGGMFVGLNSINDNLIFINRKNIGNDAGVIMGAEKSGKTYQTKREVLNALLTTNDKINIVSLTNEFDDFVSRLGGSISYVNTVNPFYMTEGYGLIEDDKKVKSMLLNALTPNSEEIEAFLKEDVDFNNFSSVLQLLTEKADTYPDICSVVAGLNGKLVNKNENNGRLFLYKAANMEEFIIIMDGLWNSMIEDKKRNITNWIFLNSVDTFLKSELRTKYLTRYVTTASAFKTVITAVVQDTVGLVNNIGHCVALEEFVTMCGYVKLLNQGPVERKKLITALNIPNALVPYITNVEPSKGLVLTNASNIAFDDNFLEKENEFTKLFI